MDEERVKRLAEQFQAFSDPNRLKILELLKNSGHPICVNGLAVRLGISQSGISQHLKILRQAGFLEVRKEGYFKHYSISEAGIKRFRDLNAEVFGDSLI